MQPRESDRQWVPSMMRFEMCFSCPHPPQVGRPLPREAAPHGKWTNRQSYPDRRQKAHRNISIEQSDADNEQLPAGGIAWFRNALDEQRRNLLAKVNRSKEEAQTAEKMPADIAEVWTETATREDMFARADSSRRLLRLVEAAILRIQQRTFGDCTEC